MNLKQKVKSFFKVKDATQATIDFIEHFLIPFSGKFQGQGNTVEDVLTAFFALEQRKFVNVVATRPFRMPGGFYIAGNRPVMGAGPRVVKKGQKILLALDKKDNTVRAETMMNGEWCQYLLKSFEFKTMEDWVEVIK